jgi:hypothetical protein
MSTDYATEAELLELLEPDEDGPWQQRAACRETDPEDFFPLKGESVEPAKQVCWGMCPVREECLDFALDNDERHGVWGGLSERERRKEARARQRAKRPQSGVSGVSWDPRKDRWVASPYIHGDRVYLGYHDTVPEAKAAIAKWIDDHSVSSRDVPAVADIWRDGRS